MKEQKYPKIKEKEIFQEINKRTGIAYSVVSEIINTYFNVVKECTYNGIEVKLNNIGTISFIEAPTKHDYKYFDIRIKKKVLAKVVPGYKKPTFKFGKTFRQELKKNTKDPAFKDIIDVSDNYIVLDEE